HQRPVNGLSVERSTNVVGSEPLAALLKRLWLAAWLTQYDSPGRCRRLQRGGIEAPCLRLLQREGNQIVGIQPSLLRRMRQRRPDEKVGEQSGLSGFHLDLAQDALLLVEHGQR